jgi:hypothetical protein
MLTPASTPRMKVAESTKRHVGHTRIALNLSPDTEVCTPTVERGLIWIKSGQRSCGQRCAGH